MNSPSKSLRTSLISAGLAAISLTAASVHISIASTAVGDPVAKAVPSHSLAKADNTKTIVRANDDILAQLVTCRESAEDKIKPRCGWISR